MFFRSSMMLRSYGAQSQVLASEPRRHRDFSLCLRGSEAKSGRANNTGFPSTQPAKGQNRDVIINFSLARELEYRPVEASCKFPYGLGRMKMDGSHETFLIIHLAVGVHGVGHAITEENQQVSPHNLKLKFVVVRALQETQRNAGGSEARDLASARQTGKGHSAVGQARHSVLEIERKVRDSDVIAQVIPWHQARVQKCERLSGRSGTCKERAHLPAEDSSVECRWNRFSGNIADDDLECVRRGIPVKIKEVAPYLPRGVILGGHFPAVQ